MAGQWLQHAPQFMAMAAPESCTVFLPLSCFKWYPPPPPPQLFHVVWRLLCIKKPLGLHRMPAGSAILLALSLAVLLPAFEFHPDALSPLAARALSFLLRG